MFWYIPPVRRPNAEEIARMFPNCKNYEYGRSMKMTKYTSFNQIEKAVIQRNRKLQKYWL